MNYNEIDINIADIHDRTKYLCALICNMAKRSNSPMFDHEVPKDLSRFLAQLQDIRTKTIDTIRLAERLRDELPR
jgi:hypothetical protein